MKKAIATIVCAVMMLFTACDLEGGTVIDKRHTQEQIHTQIIYVGGIPNQIIHLTPEQFEIIISDGKDKESISVSEKQYKKIKIGDTYKKPK